MKPILEVQHIGKKYRIQHLAGGYLSLRERMVNALKFQRNQEEDFWALKDVSFEVQAGESIGIIGRNGAGKSTLLKILSKITPPTTGRIISRGRIASLLEVGTGFHPELTGRENIFFNGSLLGMKRKEIERKFDEIVDFSGVEKFLDTPLKHFSSGMQLRLAFAVAAFLEPEILIIDEVLAVGDAEFQKKCLGKMEDVSKSGRTILFVSHNMGTVLQLCKKTILLHSGCIEMIDNSQVVIEHYYKANQNSQVLRLTSDKEIFVKNVFTCNDQGEAVTSFAHSEPIFLRITIGINRFNSQQNIGLALLTRDKKRVFTVNKGINSFYTGQEELVVDFIVPGGVIAPMNYSFLVALNTRTGIQTYDWLDDVCSIKVYDDGTDFAFAEGVDYGCIIIKDEWRQVVSSPVESI